MPILSSREKSQTNWRSISLLRYITEMRFYDQVMFLKLERLRNTEKNSLPGIEDAGTETGGMVVTNCCFVWSNLRGINSWEFSLPVPAKSFTSRSSSKINDVCPHPSSFSDSSAVWTFGASNLFSLASLLIQFMIEHADFIFEHISSLWGED